MGRFLRQWPLIAGIAAALLGPTTSWAVVGAVGPSGAGANQTGLASNVMALVTRAIGDRKLDPKQVTSALGSTLHFGSTVAHTFGADDELVRSLSVGGHAFGLYSSALQGREAKNQFALEWNKIDWPRFLNALQDRRYDDAFHALDRVDREKFLTAIDQLLSATGYGLAALAGAFEEIASLGGATEFAEGASTIGTVASTTAGAVALPLAYYQMSKALYELLSAKVQTDQILTDAADSMFWTNRQAKAADARVISARRQGAYLKGRVDLADDEVCRPDMDRVTKIDLAAPASGEMGTACKSMALLHTHFLAQQSYGTPLGGITAGYAACAAGMERRKLPATEGSIENPWNAYFEFKSCEASAAVGSWRTRQLLYRLNPDFLGPDAISFAAWAEAVDPELHNLKVKKLYPFTLIGSNAGEKEKSERDFRNKLNRNSSSVGNLGAFMRQPEAARATTVCMQSYLRMEAIEAEYRALELVCEKNAQSAMDQLPAELQRQAREAYNHAVHDARPRPRPVGR